MGTSHLIQVRPRWDLYHQVQVRPRYIREYPGPNDAQVRTRVNRSRRGPNMDRVIVFQVRPDGDHRNQVQGSPIWEPSNQIQVRSRWDHSYKDQVRRTGQQDSPSPGEAQVATSHHPGADLLRIRFTRPR